VPNIAARQGTPFALLYEVVGLYTIGVQCVYLTLSWSINLNDKFTSFIRKREPSLKQELNNFRLKRTTSSYKVRYTQKAQQPCTPPPQKRKETHPRFTLQKSKATVLYDSAFSFKYLAYLLMNGDIS